MSQSKGSTLSSINFVMRSSKMSLKSKNIKYYFLAFAICVIFKLQFCENPVEIGQLVLKNTSC